MPSCFTLLLPHFFERMCGSPCPPSFLHLGLSNAQICTQSVWTPIKMYVFWYVTDYFTLHFLLLFECLLFFSPGQSWTLKPSKDCSALAWTSWRETLLTMRSSSWPCLEVAQRLSRKVHEKTPNGPWRGRWVQTTTMKRGLSFFFNTRNVNIHYTATFDCWISNIDCYRLVSVEFAAEQHDRRKPKQSCLKACLITFTMILTLKM